MKLGATYDSNINAALSRTVASICAIIVVGFFGITSSLAVPPPEILTEPTPTNSLLEQSITGEFYGSTLSAAEGETYMLCNIATFGFGPGGGSDVWGWRAPDGTEYAIVGTESGLGFVDATKLTVVLEVEVPFGACPSAWRDIKTYQHYCYTVSDCGGAFFGIRVYDLQFLPDSVHLVGDFPVDGAFQTPSHNLSIDTATGYLYAEGSNTINESVFIHDLSDPENPVFVGGFGPSDVHDMFVRNDTAYLAHGSQDAFSIWDVSNKNAPVALANVLIPGGNTYCHNIWPLDDGLHVATTEEIPGRPVKIWNTQDMNNIQLVGAYIGPAQIPHNVHVRGDTLFIAHYESGMIVVDVADPSNPVEVAIFDTYPASDNATFNGCWGVYPHSQENLIYVSNRSGALYILKELMVILGDTMALVSAGAPPGGSVKVAVTVTNSLDVRSMVIPIEWAGSFDMIFDSVSTNGTRTEHFTTINFTAFDPFSKRLSVKLIGSLSGQPITLPPGAGPVLNFYFSIPESATGDSNLVTIKPFGGHAPGFITACATAVTPITSDATITFGCCQVPGDANGSSTVNISDATFLIAYIFSGGAEPDCLAQADANGSGSINISDATYLIAMIFSGGAPPICL